MENKIVEIVKEPQVRPEKLLSLNDNFNVLLVELRDSTKIIKEKIQNIKYFEELNDIKKSNSDPQSKELDFCNELEHNLLNLTLINDDLNKIVFALNRII